MSDGQIKVLHLITGLETGGAELTLYRLTEAMDRDRFENIVVSLTSSGPISAAISNLGIKVYSIGMSYSWSSLFGLWRLYKLLLEEQPDILQTWLYHADFCGLLTGRAARVPAITWNIRCSDMGKEYKSGFNKLLLRMLGILSHFPQAIVTNSLAGQKEHTALGYKPKRWVLLENGFNLEIFKPSPEARISLRRELLLQEEIILIGLIARYDPIKDHKTFLNAAAILLKKKPSVHFVLAGDGVTYENKELSSLINLLKIQTQVHLLGPRADVPRITAGLDVATCCSLAEGFPNVVGEAMACAVPCVVTDVGDAAKMIGKAGIVVPANNADALASAWEKIIRRDWASRVALGASGHSRIKNHYTLAICMERYQKFYEELAQDTATYRKYK